MKKLMSLLVALGVLLCPAAALAQEPAPTPKPKTPVVTKRQRHQQQRIGPGVRSGELTVGEAIRLEKEQQKIQENKQEAKADGKVTARERASLQRQQNRSSRHVYRAKHNRRDRN